MSVPDSTDDGETRFLECPVCPYLAEGETDFLVMNDLLAHTADMAKKDDKHKELMGRYKTMFEELERKQ